MVKSAQKFEAQKKKRNVFSSRTNSTTTTPLRHTTPRQEDKNKHKERS
jgi:hypothetical protein